MEAVNQVEKVFSDALELKEIKRRLLNVVVQNFDMGSEKYDSAIFRILVEETVAQIEFPVFNIDISDAMNGIAAKFTGELTSAGQKTELTAALSKAISRIYDELCKKLISSVAEFKAEMKNISKTVENSLLENINNEFEILLSQYEHKENEIAEYKSYIELLDKEIPRLKEKIQSVQLCFTTDPFMYGYPEIQEMSLAAIRKLNEAHIKCCVLTKGLLPIELKDLYSENEYGITLISLDEDYRERIEPGAASYTDRLVALKALHDAGCKTWVSIEPYPTPNLIKQSLREILEAVNFTDRIIFGRTNYNKTISAYKDNKHFYNECAKEVIDFCEKQGISYHIKEKTQTKE